MSSHYRLSTISGRQIWRALPVVLPFLVGCGGSGSTDAPPQTPPTQNPGYSTTTIGGVSGDNQSTAFSVNNAGQVVGQSADGTGLQHGFYWDGSVHNLTAAGYSGAAYAISNGSPVYAGGYQEIINSGVRNAVLWTPASSTTGTVLETSHSWVMGVNDAGVAAGRYVDASAHVHGAIWRVGQNRVDIPPLTGHVHTSALDINNDGIVAGISFGDQTITNRAWVRLATGEVIELLAAADAIGAEAWSLSDVVNGQFYVVGSSYNAQATRHAIRWTFQVATKSATQEELAMTVATGVTSLGAVSGILVTGQTSAAVLWRNGTYTALGGSSSSGGRAVAASAPWYVAGDVFSAGLPVAVRWTIP